MKKSNLKLIFLFLAGFFAKDTIDNIGFLAMDQYPLHIFGLTITATAHTIMLVVSILFTSIFLYYGLRRKEQAT